MSNILIACVAAVLLAREYTQANILAGFIYSGLVILILKYFILLPIYQEAHWPFLYWRRIIRLDELPFVVRRSRRITKHSSSRRIMHLVPVFIPETLNQTNYLILTYFRAYLISRGFIFAISQQKGLKGFKILRKYRLYFRVFCYIAKINTRENK